FLVVVIDRSHGDLGDCVGDFNVHWLAARQDAHFPSALVLPEFPEPRVRVVRFGLVPRDAVSASVRLDHVELWRNRRHPRRRDAPGNDCFIRIRAILERLADVVIGGRAAVAWLAQRAPGEMGLPRYPTVTG